MDKKLQRLLNQLRKIEEHRERGAYTAIRKEYKAALKDVRRFLGEEYAKLAEDGKLTYEILRGKQEYSRFLEEVQQRFAYVGVRETQQITKAVEETYEAAYKGMVDAVSKAGDDREALAAIKFGLSPEVIKSAVENPIAGLTLVDSLEKHRAEIIYNIKKQIGIGLTNGDSMPTMAKRIQKSLEGDYQKAIRIVRTEVHRVREAGHVDAAQHLDKVVQSGKSGKRMTKTWRTMKDERVRPNRLRKTKSGWKRSVGGTANHVKMEGVTVLADELFDLGGNVKAMAPGQSGDASNDINCRCIVEYNLMSDEEYFAATGKHFGGAEEPQRYSDLFEVDEDWSPREETAAWDAIRSQNVTEDELKEVTTGYIGTPASWEINEAFREYPGLSTKDAFTKFFEGVPYEDVEETIKVADALDSLIKKNVIPKNSELTRYVSADYMEEVFGLDMKELTDIMVNFDDDGVKDALKKFAGTKVTERGFMSTSANGSYTSFGNRSVVLKLQVDEGTHAYITDNIVEAEVILGRNTEYQILGFQKGKRNKLEVIAKVLKK